MVDGNPANIPDGPFSGFNPLVSIQQLVRSQHQCLIAEIAYDLDPIPANADPSISDKLAQRNLAFVNVPNPGVEPSRIAPQTFEVRRSPLTLKVDNRPDELMIDWRSVPAGTTASFYLPGTTAAAILTGPASYTPPITLRRLTPTLCGCLRQASATCRCHKAPVRTLPD